MHGSDWESSSHRITTLKWAEIEIGFILAYSYQTDSEVPSIVAQKSEIYF